MTEASNQPGVYFGAYMIQPRDPVQDLRVVVTMTRAGLTSRAEASARLTIVAGDRVPSPVISSPVPGTRLGDPIVIRGTATPGYRVNVRVDYQGSVLVFNLRGTFGQVSTTADAAGNWSVAVNQKMRVPDAELTITAVAIDPLGRQSEPAVLKAVSS